MKKLTERRIKYLLTGGILGFVVATLIHTILTYIWVVAIVFVVGVVIGTLIKRK